MRGRKKTYPVELSETEADTLRTLANSRTQPYGEVQRARALVTCAEHPDWSDEQVAAHIGVSPRMVRLWRKRWHETRSIQEAPRSGRPRVFSPRSAGTGDGVGMQYAGGC